MNKKTLRNLRLINNLSQSDFAERVGLSQQMVSDIERGVRPLSDRTRVKVLSSFEFSPELLSSLEKLSQFDDEVV